VILDLRKPVLIFAGSFNPAIFSAPWMARSLFGVPEGEEVEVTSVLDLGEGPPPRHYIQKVGVLVQSQRLAIYPDEMTEEVIGRAETAFSAVAETLPHTPVAAFGINFQFDQLAVTAELVDSVMPRDGLEALGQINSTEVGSNIAVGERDQLNISRQLSGESVGVSFNFHYPITGLQEVAEGRKPNIAEAFNRAKLVLSNCYGQDLDDLQFQRALN
jgi:hypothetical protein